MESTALVPEGFLAPSKYADEKAHALMAGESFLPRIQIMQMNANVVKKKKCNGGIYALVKGSDNVLMELGEQFSCLVLGWRPKALKFDGDDTKAFYNPNSLGFKEVEAKAPVQNSGCVFGPEYLVYIPDVEESLQIAYFHFNNKSMRRSCSPMKDNQGRAVTCRTELVEKKQYTWHSPVIVSCSTPLNIPQMGTPERDVLNNRLSEALKLFNNPKDEEVEVAPEPTTEDRPR